MHLEQLTESKEKAHIGLQGTGSLLEKKKSTSLEGSTVGMRGQKLFFIFWSFL